MPKIPIISRKIDKLKEKYALGPQNYNTLQFIEDPAKAQPLVEIHINAQAEILNGLELYDQIKKISSLQEKQLEEVANHPEGCCCCFCTKMRETYERLEKEKEEEEARIAAEQKAMRTPKAKMAKMVKEAGNKVEKIAQSCKKGVCNLSSKKPLKPPHHYVKESACTCGSTRCGAAAKKKTKMMKGGLDVVYTPRKKDNCCSCRSKKNGSCLRSLLSQL